MKLQIVSKSQVTTAVSLIALNVAANWQFIAPVVDEAKQAPWFAKHHFVFTVVVALTSMLLAFGRSLLAHKSGLPPKSAQQDVTPDRL